MAALPAAPASALRRLAPPLVAVVATLAATTVAARPAHAGDVAEIDHSPVRLEITETSLLNYHLDNRNDKTSTDVESRIDDNYGEWLNKFNVTAAWKSWQAGLRFDTATYFHRPSESRFDTDTEVNREAAQAKLAYRYRDQYLVSPGLPSKYYLTYSKPDIELTAGDAYVAFGRGLVLSMRKIDELGTDTSLQGAKVTGRLFKVLSLTLVAGIANPNRVDEATGVVLRDALATDATGYRSVWSKDEIFGARTELKIGTATLGAHVADVHRRANLGFLGDPSITSKDIEAGGISLAIPKLSKAVPLNIYTEFAVQHRVPFALVDQAGNATGPLDLEKNGYAGYGALSLTTGAVTSTLEGKHYRSFYPEKLNADPSIYANTGFKAVQYNAPPTVELITQDALFDNTCTTGGRGRVDVRATKAYLVFASVGYFENWGERSPTSCGVTPAFGIIQAKPSPQRNDIVDGYLGFELRSQHDSSYATAMAGVRHDTEAESGLSYYREAWVQFDLVKTLDEKYSVELQGWHRNRFEAGGGSAFSEDWHEGEDYLGLKYTSKRSIFIGHEYTTKSLFVKPGAFLTGGGVQHYLNVGAQFKFDENLSLRLFAGQQRAALKCVSGVCRQFPAFEGLKAELVVRY